MKIIKKGGAGFCDNLDQLIGNNHVIYINIFKKGIEIIFWIFRTELYSKQQDWIIQCININKIYVRVVPITTQNIISKTFDISLNFNMCTFSKGINRTSIIFILGNVRYICLKIKLLELISCGFQWKFTHLQKLS